jgi:branched-chain amino acid transport system substrate-binding protein
MSQHQDNDEQTNGKGLIGMAPTRRQVVNAGAALIAAPAILWTIPANAQSKTLKIGFVSPRSGPLAGFAEADEFILSQVRQVIGQGITNNGVRYPVEIIVKDSQSNPNRAAEVALELINGDKVDIITAIAAPETTNPVADQAEANEIPCITTNCPWQPYFFGRNGNPAKGFDWTYHFFWGLEDVIAAFLSMWDGMPTNKVVGGIFPNDADGNAWGDPKLGLPPALAKAGYKLIDTGRFTPMSNDFTAQISAYKQAGCEIVTGNMIPPDFATFWAQCAQQGFKPKIVTIGKALLFPSVINSLGDRGDGLSTEIWWGPTHPFKSSLTGQSTKEMTDAFMAATKRPWTQPIGFTHSLFEVTLDVLKRAKDLKSPKSILAAITETNVNTIVGPIKWGNGPVKNVTKTELVAGQWVKGPNGFELVITTNKPAPNIPVGGKLKPLA